MQQPGALSASTSQHEVAHLGNKAAVVHITAGQQNIQAGQVSMQDIQAVQVSHARGNLPGSSQDADQVRQAIDSRPICPKPTLVDAILQAHMREVVTILARHMVAFHYISVLPSLPCENEGASTR